jgi:hypothetical protein
MAWLKTIDGDLVNLDSGVRIGIYEEAIDPYVRIYTPGGPGTGACYGTESENREYMKGLEIQLRDSGETIIDPS